MCVLVFQMFCELAVKKSEATPPSLPSRARVV